MKTLIAVLAFSIGSIVPIGIASAVSNVGAHVDHNLIKDATTVQVCRWWYFPRCYR